MRHVLAIFVGAVVSLLAGAIFLGPQNLGFLLLIAVVCTYGVGLVPLVFVFWLVGLMVLAFFPQARPTTPGNGAPKWGPGEQGIRSLVYYMEKAKRGGKSDEEIDFCMVRAGWLPDEIEQARRLCPADY